MSNDNRTVAENIRFIRRWNKITQLELGKRCGLSDSTISDIEKCRQTTSIDHYLQLLAIGLDTTVEALTETNQSIIDRLDSLSKNIELHRDDISDEIVSESDSLIEETSNHGAKVRFRAYLLRGEIAYSKYMYSEALKYFEVLPKIARITNDPEQKHLARHNTARAYLQKGDYDSALKMIQEDLADPKTNQSLFRAKNYQALGLLHKRQLQYAEAESSLIRAVEEMQKGDNQNYIFFARNYQLLGDLYRDLCEFDKSVHVSRISIDYAEKCSDNLTVVYAKRTIAMVMLELGEKNDAFSLFKELQYLSQRNDLGEIELLKNSYYIFLCNDEIENVMDTLNKLKRFEMQSKELSKMFERAGNLAREKKLFEQAMNLYKEALDLRYN